jgi:predicted nucleotidyltransferase
VQEEEPNLETIEAEKERKAEMVSNFMERHEAYMYDKQEAREA